MVRDVIDGFLGFFGAFKDLSKYGLWKFVWISGFLCLFVAAIFYILIAQYYDDLGGAISGFYTWETGKSFVTKALNIISGALMGIAVILIFKYIILILVSPIMSLVSEKIEKSISGFNHSGGGFNFAALIRGLRLSLSNIFREIGLTLILLILVIWITPWNGIIISDSREHLYLIIKGLRLETE